MGARADSEESIEAFNMDVNEIEKYASIWPRTLIADFSSRDHLESAHRTRCDSISHSVSEGQEILLTVASLRWYRLAFASTLLPSMSNWRDVRQSMRLSVDWASQILYHLSSAATSTPFNPESGLIQGPLEPDTTLVALLSFAIDQYFVVM